MELDASDTRAVETLSVLPEETETEAAEQQETEGNVIISPISPIDPMQNSTEEADQEVVIGTAAPPAETTAPEIAETVPSSEAVTIIPLE